MKKLLDFLTLFTSTSTLICCALPATLVALGAGGVMASLVSNFPALIWVSNNKVPVFIFAGVMLALGGVLQWRARYLSCPADPALAKACAESRAWSLRIYFASLAMFFIGGYFAFVAPYLL